MDFNFTPTQEAFRLKLLEWMKKKLPGDASSTSFQGQSDFERADVYKEFQKGLFESGFAAMHYPREYGGQGLTLMEEVIVLETIASICPEIRTPGLITHATAAPTIYVCGNEEQKKNYLPQIFNGTNIWCQAFSEPNAGSDLSNLSTRAERDGDYYVLNGQKIWTSWAHVANYCIILVRTDPKEVRYRGLSYFILDLTLPGIDIRPIRQITGDSEFCELFLDNVRVPSEMMLGEEGQGWNIAITTLMFERVLGDAVMGAYYLRNMALLVESARQIKRSGRPVLENPIFRQQIAQAYIEIMAVKYHGYRSLSQQVSGAPGPEGSIGKLLWSETNQRLMEWAVGMQGPNGQITGGHLLSVQEGLWQYGYLRSRANTIEAGSSEIQRNIIGERVLGLPKEIGRSKSV